MKSKDRMKFITTRDNTPAEQLLKTAGASNTLLKKAFREGRVTSTRGVLYKTTRLNAGEEIYLDFAEETSNLIPTHLQQTILYEDEDILALNKGIIPTMPCQMYPTNTLANEIAGHFAAIGLKRKVRLLGRLDKETTGVIIACKNPLAYQRLVKNHTKNKRYCAVVLGRLIKDGTIDAPIGPGNDSLVRVVRQDGQHATTHYRVLKSGDESFIELTLETGRCHQIRCHMAAIGAPIKGDGLYGGGSGPMHLHVQQITFRHPRSGEKMTIAAKPPSYFDKHQYKHTET